MRKTLIPNSIIILSVIYVTVIVWAVITAENEVGVIFYAVALGLSFVVFIYNRDSLASTLKIEDSTLKINYVFPNKEDIDINLYMIQGNITLRRFHGLYFAGGLPSWPDYLNYKWYFSSESYELEFIYAGDIKIISFQTNPIGFRSFLNYLVESINAVNEYNIQHTDSNLGKGELIVSLSSLIIKLLIP